MVCHHPKRALRNWRVIKLYTLLALVALQDATAEWGVLPLEPRSSNASEEATTMQDLYYQMILTAPSLAPLKSSKEKPRMSASNCLHPKAELKGGGNGSQSYIVCKACHARWLSPISATELREHLKKEKKGGPLGQKPKAKAAPDVSLMMPAREEEVLRIKQEQIHEGQRVAALEEQMYHVVEEMKRREALQMEAMSVTSSAGGRSHWRKQWDAECGIAGLLGNADATRG